MADTFEIKPATPQDTPLLLAFILELATYEKRAHEVDATEELLHTALFGPHAHVEALVGYLNGKPVSFAIFFQNFSTYRGRSGIYVEDLFVKPEARGKGIGQNMLSHVARIAKSRHCIRMEWSALDWNEDAIGFYKRLGATAVSGTKYRISDTALNTLANN